MSRLGKKPIAIPQNVEVKINDGKVCVKGPRGELCRDFRKIISITLVDNAIKLEPKSEGNNALWGTYVAHIKNMIKGVTEGFSKLLIIEGIGFKAQITGKELVMNLGFSHQVKKPIPIGIEVKVEKNKLGISGNDKEQVGQFSAEIRSLKKPEPYKGKGIRYDGEIIRRKAGKKAMSSAG